MKTAILVSLAACLVEVHGFWRLSCGQIQTARIDPVINPGTVSSHTHVIAGAYNVNISSTQDSLSQSFCTSCAIQADKSAYWTPLLYYKTVAGKFINVPTRETVAYYLGRGKDDDKTVPFPKGFRMVSGNPNLRHYDNDTRAYGGSTPLAERVSFVCLKSGYVNNTRLPYLADTDCKNGLRAQITFPSCWDGVNPWLDGNKHVAYLSNIENGVCPPTHQARIPHLFYEIMYSPNQIDTSDGGQFVFAQGDPTGYGFHGDFLNGWDQDVLAAGVQQCLRTQSGDVDDCPPFQPSVDNSASTNCPEQPSYYDEPVKGTLNELPGCNPVVPGPADATTVSCTKNPSRSNAQRYLDGVKRSYPTPGTSTASTSSGTATYRGCFPEGDNGRVYSKLKGDDSLTIDSCAAWCKSNSFTWFGLEYGRECWCGSAVPSTTAVADKECSMVCKGDFTQWCGDSKRLSVYQVSTSTSRVKRGVDA